METYQTGSTAELTYDRSNDPATKTYTATGLTYALYAFKVVAVNAIGDGLQVQPHQLLSQELGSSASHTTARGSAMHQGISDVIYEAQRLSATSTFHETFTLSWSGKASSLALTTAVSETDLKSTLEAPAVGIGDVHVTKSEIAGDVIILVTFIGKTGNVAELVASDNDLKVEEHVRGVANEFIIEPKQHSGGVVKDLDAFDGFEGTDLFFTELWSTPPSVIDGTHFQPERSCGPSNPERSCGSSHRYESHMQRHQLEDIVLPLDPCPGLSGLARYPLCN